MSEAKHTKGKWSVSTHFKTNENGAEYLTIDCLEDGSGVEGLAVVYEGVHGDPRAEMEANARLIAEAPTLKGYLSSARVVLARMRRSMMAHPDHEVGSEFDDLTTESQILEDEIIELIKKIEG